MSKFGIFLALIFIICAVIVSGYVIGVTYEEDLYKKGNEFYIYSNQREYIKKGNNDTSFDEEYLKIYDNGGYIYTFLGTETLKSGKLKEEDLNLLLELSEQIDEEYYYYDNEEYSDLYDFDENFGSNSKIYNNSKNKWIEITSEEKYNTSACVSEISEFRNKLLEETRDKTNSLSIDGFINFYKDKIEYVKKHINK